MLLILEYVVTGVFFCRSLVHDDMDDVVLTEAVSDEEALDVLLRRENGLEIEGIVEVRLDRSRMIVVGGWRFEVVE